MTAAFADLQRAYAEHRVATYPLTESKRPAIRGYDRVGPKGSQQLAMKFPTATACGFVAGHRNRLTIVDIDSPDDRLCDEIQDRFGPTPLQVLTPSGGRHLYYRHAGEARRIRPLQDVDILGDGNVVAARSIVPKGKYQIERGTLDDLDRLPPMRQEPGHGKGPAQGRIPRGERNQALFEHCRSTVSYCDTCDQLLDAARTWADDRFATPLPAAEILKTVNSVWNYRGGRKQVMQHIVEAPEFGALIADPDALALFAYLSAENGPDAEFWIADGLGEARGWPTRFVPKARKALLAMGVVECIRPRGNRRPALYRWRIGR
jgi:Bifunctional DNA primase/polymerase, N-terminal/Primase C terminal 1 (PriCT-1)